MMKLIRAFIRINVAISRWFDRTFLSSAFITDGNRDFIDDLVPRYLRPGAKIYDVGGGKRPYLDVTAKHVLGAYVVGIDISQQELVQAPTGAYDEILCADIAGVRGNGDGDLVICQAVLEHVQDTEGAMASIASLLKPGGKALIFVPSRNAVYARLNLLLSENIKCWLLWSIFPDTRQTQGFPSYYHKCSPDDFQAMAKCCDMTPREIRCYYVSSYFTFLFPVYFLWRMWIVLFRAVAGRQAAETYSMVLVKCQVSCDS